ncbi:MAG: cellulase family glycosylhydrolase, partial [Acidobacteriota bacterium]
MTPNRRNSASANAAPSRPRLRIWLTLLLLSLGLLPSDAEAARGRPFIGRGTVLTDTGTLLRGPRVSLDRDVPAPTFTELQDIKNRGGNALHVYAEREGDPSDSGAGPTPGYKLAELTGLVNLTRTLDMYLVITVGNAPGSFDHDFAVDFWDLYAAEFGDEPHVIFELQNEPYARFCPIHQSAPSPLAVLEMERDAYCKVREHAPDSMVLLFSYAMFTLASGVLQDIDDLQPMVVDPVDGCGQSIDWSRTAIAFHGYHFPTLRGTMETVTGAGYGIVQTEFGPYCDLEIHCGTGECFGCDDPATCDVGALAVEHLELHEELGISWFTFMRVDRYLDDASFRDPVDAADLLWLPDFGNWPASSDPPIGATVSFFS